jgi:SAM-dependent methyltransferase
MHLNSKLLFEKYAKDYFNQNIKVLELGPDKFPSTYQSIIDDKSIEWDTIDINKHPNLKYCALDEYSYPIDSESYDIVLSGQVLEHVKKVWIWIKELARVCKRGGLIITINPVSWIYHEVPVDCWRVFPEGMKALYEEADLEIILSIFESLELPHYRHYIPGISLNVRHPLYRFANKLLGKIGYPVECAYDTITIGKKL